MVYFTYVAKDPAMYRNRASITAKQLYERLSKMGPTLYFGAQLRTLQRQVKAWRSNRARKLVIRILGGVEAMEADAITPRQLPSQILVGGN